MAPSFPQYHRELDLPGVEDVAGVKVCIPALISATATELRANKLEGALIVAGRTAVLGASSVEDRRSGAGHLPMVPDYVWCIPVWRSAEPSKQVWEIKGGGARCPGTR